MLSERRIENGLAKAIRHFGLLEMAKPGSNKMLAAQVRGRAVRLLVASRWMGSSRLFKT